MVLHRSEIAIYGSLFTRHSSPVTAFLIGNEVTIEIRVTHSKQTIGTDSNR